MALAASSTDRASLIASRDFADAVESLQSLAADDMARVNAALLDSLSSPVAMIPELAGHLLRAGGKRLRPMLTIAAARIYGYDGDDHIKLAAAVELIHGATLLHDDVVDASSLRRGARTANVIWGNKESVLVGDFVFSRAFELMVAAKDLKVLKILSAASGVIAEGEVLQLSTQKNLAATFDMYLAVVEAKTAALFAAAAEAGAVIGGCADSGEQALRQYGRNLGVAYQLIDDALDYAGFEPSLGKRVGDDFREGKMTLPVVFAIERASPSEQAFWRRVIAEGRQVHEDFEEARAILERTGAIEDTIACAQRFAEAAVKDIAGVPANAWSEALAALAATSTARAF